MKPFNRLDSGSHCDTPGHQHEKKILRENRETGGFLIEAMRIFECFLRQRNSKIRTFLIRPGIQL